MVLVFFFLLVVFLLWLLCFVMVFVVMGCDFCNDIYITQLIIWIIFNIYFFLYNYIN